MARPKMDKYAISYMVKRIDEYIETRKKTVPILKECCLLNEWDYDYVMKLQRKSDRLRQSIKKLLDWKEVKLEQGALSGKLDKTFVIFSLKQPAHGWTDKPTSDSAEISNTIKESIDSLTKVLSNPEPVRNIEDFEHE